jgi:hypothetical protein
VMSGKQPLDDATPVTDAGTPAAGDGASAAPPAKKRKTTAGGRKPQEEFLEALRTRQGAQTSLADMKELLTSWTDKELGGVMQELLNRVRHALRSRCTPSLFSQSCSILPQSHCSICLCS